MLTMAVCLQIMNHFSEPFSILKYCAASRDLQSIGTAEPEKEFHVDLDAYRYDYPTRCQVDGVVILVS